MDNLKREWNQLFSLITRSGTSISTYNSASVTQATTSITAIDVETDDADFYELFNHLGYSVSDDSWQTPQQCLQKMLMILGSTAFR